MKQKLPKIGSSSRIMYFKVCKKNREHRLSERCKLKSCRFNDKKNPHSFSHVHVNSRFNSGFGTIQSWCDISKKYQCDDCYMNFTTKKEAKVVVE